MQNVTKCNEVTISSRMYAICKLKYFNSLLPQKLHASNLPQKITPF